MMIMIQQIGIALLIVCAALLLSRIVKWLLVWLRRRLAKRTKTAFDDVLIHAAMFPAQAFIVLWGIEIAAGTLTFLPGDWETQLNRAFFAADYLLIYIFLYRLTSGLIKWYGSEIVHRTETDLDDQFLDLFRYAALIMLTITVAIIILGRYGVDVSALVTTLGITSLAVALAAKDTLSNMISGFTLLVDQPFRKGDRVEILDIGAWGDVVDIGLRSTRILTRDNRMVTVPNSVISQGLIVNYSDPSTKYRVETHVGVAYGTNIEEARQILIEAVKAQTWVMGDQRIEALFMEFGDSALTFRVRCWIEHYVETRRIIDKLNTALYIALDEAGVGIPFPQLDVRLLEDYAIAERSPQPLPILGE